MSHYCGRMVEWFKAAVLKTAEGQLSVGSNPTPSAIFFVLISRQKHEAGKGFVSWLDLSAAALAKVEEPLHNP